MIRLAALASLCLVSLLPAHAQTRTWTGATDSVWNTSANWTDDTPDQSDETAAFGPAASDRRNLTFSTYSFYTLAGLTFDSDAAPFAITVNDTSRLTLSGAGILNNSANAQSLTSTSGTLIFNDSSTAGGGTGSGVITIETRGTFDGRYALTQFNGNSTVGRAHLIVSTEDNPLANDLGAKLVFNNTAPPTNNSAEVIFNNSTAGTATTNSTATTSGSGSSRSNLIFNGTATAASATINATGTNNGYVYLNFNQTSVAGSAHINLASQASVEFNDNSSADHAVITGAAKTSTLTLNQSATAGNATITTDGSILFYGNANAGSASITVNPSVGTLLAFGESSSAAHAQITLGGGGELRFNGTATAGNATVTFNDSFLRITGGGSGGDASFTLNAGGTADVGLANGPVVTLGSIARSGTIRLGSNQLAVGGNGASTIFSGVLADGGLKFVTGASLNKTGAGTLTLSGANTYTGATLVSAGTLVVNGTLASSSESVAAGATLAPGNSPGTLKAGDTTFEGGGIFAFEINDADGVAGANWDQLVITGSLTLAATSSDPVILQLTSLDLLNFDASADYSFTFLTTTTEISGFSANLFAIDSTSFTPASHGTWEVALLNGDKALALTYTASAIPEPSTCVLLAALALVITRRRQSSRSH